MIAVEKIAQVCHEANRAWCAAHGDKSSLPWDSAPEHIKASAIAGVETVLRDGVADPRVLHEAWMRFKINDGWRWGERKNFVAKTHPCLVSWDKLPAVERKKDALFLAIVKSLA